MSDESNLNRITSRFPFSTYDVFGYLIPGAFFIFLCLMFDIWIFELGNKEEGFYVPFRTALSLVLKSSVFENVTFSIVLLIFGAIVTYVVGHIIASVSAFALDRLLINKGYYYPFFSVVGKQNQLRITNEKKVVRAMFIFLNSFLIIFWLHFSLFIFHEVNVTAYIASLFSNLQWLYKVSVTVILIFVAYVFMFRKRGGEKSDLKITYMTSFFAWIYQKAASIVGAYTGINKPLSDEMISAYKDFVEEEFAIQNNKTSDLYWLCYMYVSTRSQVHLSKLLNWLHLYSFSRNISTAIYLAGIYILIGYSVNSFAGLEADYVMLLAFPVMLFGSIMMLVRYYYLYKNYYSKYLIRACVFLHSQKNGVPIGNNYSTNSSSDEKIQLGIEK